MRKIGVDFCNAKLAYNKGEFDIESTQLFIPENFSFFNFPELDIESKKFQTRLNQYLWLLHVIVSRTVENKHEIKHNDGWVKINKKALEGYIQSHNIAEIRDNLISWGVIECDFKYLTGLATRGNKFKAKSYSFRLTPEYRFQNIKEIQVKEFRFWYYNNRHKNSQKNLIESNDYLKELKGYYENLEFDIEKAENYIEQCSKLGQWLPVPGIDKLEPFTISQKNHCDLILKRIKAGDLYFKVSENTSRVYTVITNMPKRLRRFLKINGQDLFEIDQCAAHPTYFFEFAEKLLDKKKIRKDFLNYKFKFKCSDATLYKIKSLFNKRDLTEFLSELEYFDWKDNYQSDLICELLYEIQIYTNEHDKREFLKSVRPTIRERVLKDARTLSNNNYINIVMPYYSCINEFYTKSSLLPKFVKEQGELVLNQDKFTLPDLILKTINIHPFSLDFKEFFKKKKYIKMKPWIEDCYFDLIGCTESEYYTLMKGEKNDSKKIFEKYDIQNKFIGQESSWIFNIVYDYMIRSQMETYFLQNSNKLSIKQVSKLNFRKDFISIIKELIVGKKVSKNNFESGENQEINYIRSIWFEEWNRLFQMKEYSLEFYNNQIRNKDIHHEEVLKYSLNQGSFKIFSNDEDYEDYFSSQETFIDNDLVEKLKINYELFDIEFPKNILNKNLYSSPTWEKIDSKHNSFISNSLNKGFVLFPYLNSQLISSINILINAKLLEILRKQNEQETILNDFLTNNRILYDYVSYYNSNDQNENKQEHRRTSCKIGMLSSMNNMYKKQGRNKFIDSYSRNHPIHLVFQQVTKVLGIKWCVLLQKTEAQEFVFNHKGIPRYTVHDSILTPLDLSQDENYKKYKISRNF